MFQEKTQRTGLQIVDTSRENFYEPKLVSSHLQKSTKTVFSPDYQKPTEMLLDHLNTWTNRIEADLAHAPLPEMLPSPQRLCL